MLANVDADLCAQVAAGLGLPAPKGTPGRGRHRLARALSQIVAEPGPIAGRKIGVIADAGSDLAGIAKLRQSDCGARRHRVGDRPRRRRAQGGPAHASPSTARWPPPARSSSTRSSWPAAPRRPATSSWSCCCRRPSGTARPSPPGATATAVLNAARIPPRDPGVAVADDVDKAFTANLAARAGACTGPGTGRQVMASAVPPAG